GGDKVHVPLPLVSMDPHGIEDVLLFLYPYVLTDLRFEAGGHKGQHRPHNDHHDDREKNRITVFIRIDCHNDYAVSVFNESTPSEDFGNTVAVFKRFRRLLILPLTT